MKRVFVYETLTGGGAPELSGSTDAGLLAMGRSMRDAVAADLLAARVYDVSVASAEAHAPAQPGATPRTPVPAGATQVAPQPGEAATAFVARLADSHHHVWVIAPETGGLLAQLHRGVDPARWLGCDGAAITLASAKRATSMRLAEAGLTTPLAFEHDAEITRWVVKPDDGAGAIDTQVHASLEAAMQDWSARSRAGSPMAIEPWVEGPALSLSLLCRDGRAELLSVNRQRVEVVNAGRVAYRGVDVNVLPLHPARNRRRGAAPNALALRAFAQRVVQAMPGLRGYVGVDLVWHAQRGPVAIEVNPRVTCAYVGLSRALGRNLADEIVAGARPP